MFLILALSTLSSGTDYVFAQSVPENFESIPKSKNFTIDLTEKVGFTETKKQIDKSKTYSVSLQERIAATSYSVHDELVLIKHESDRKIMMERIFDRQSKFKINESKLLQILSPSTLTYHEQDILDDDLIFLDQNLSFDKLYPEINDLIPNIFESEKTLLNFVNINHDVFIQNNVEFLNDQIFDPENPILLILLIPFAGFVLIRYDNEQTKFYQVKQIFTFTFIIILVSSAVITPMSISSSYWGYAYGEMDNSTEIISQIEEPEIILQNNFTNISEPDDNFSEIDFSNIVSAESYSTQSNNDMSMSDILSTALSKFTGNTTPDTSDSSSTDSSSTGSDMSMSDILSTALSKFTGNTTPDTTDSSSTDSSSTDSSSTDSSSTDSSSTGSDMSMSDILSTALSKFTGNTTPDSSSTGSDMSMSDILIIALSKFTGNTTSSTIYDTSSTGSDMSMSDVLEIFFTPRFPTEDAVLSLQFDSIENGTTSDDAKINEHSLELDGDQDFLQINENSTNNVSSLVISAWVKPDYSQGSPEFTVISKEKSFSLTVDNQISSNIAKFSIFDGIKWTQIGSQTEIPEEWTQLTASFSNQTLSIYINGELEGTKQLESVPSLSTDGTLEFVDIQNISSENDIVVGAYITTKDNLPQPNNMFSGMIDNVLLFNYTLSESQIGQLYSQSISTHSQSQTKSLDEILKEIEQEAGLFIQNNTQTTQAQLSISDSITTIHAQAQILPSDALQAQLSISDSITTIHAQAPNNTQTTQAQILPSDALQAQLSISDSITTTHAQAPNSTSTSLVVPNVTPILTPTKETFTIAEDAEIIFEFYDESEAMTQELENLDITIEIAETDTDSVLNPSPLEDIFGLFVLPIPEADAAKDDGPSIKAQIKQIKKEIKQIKKSETVSEAELDAIKNKIKLLIEQIKDEVKESKKQKKIDKLNSVLTKFEKIINKNQKQKDNWIDKKETITTEVYDANGNRIELDLIIEKQREGKFNIKIDPANAKPGIYKIKTILNVDGKQFISESQFAWGLVTVNSLKSIYKPGELAELEIVVLNGTGAPVCPANIVMQITDPNSSSNIITSDDVIEASCGLYVTSFPTSVTGNYTIGIKADTGNGIVNFATYFTVLDNYDYDIVRYTDSKIDPFNDPNDYDVDIDITSFVGNEELTIREYVPSSFEIFNTDAAIEIIGNQKVLTWTKTPQNGYVNTFGYSYSVPLVTPELYPLGKMQIDQSGIPTFTEARNWFVAVDPHTIIDPTVVTTNDIWQDASKRTVAINGTHIYTFYVDGSVDLSYSYSTDAGESWINGGVIDDQGTPAPPASVSNALFRGTATWYEPDTPGLTDPYIHIASFDSNFDTMFYMKFDPRTNTVATPLVDIGNGDSSGVFGSLVTSGNVAITVSTNGTVYVGTVDNALPAAGLSSIRACTETGASACGEQSDWGNVGGQEDVWLDSDNGNDSVILLPLSDGDIALISLDVSTAATLRSKTFESTNNTWSSDWSEIDTGITDNSSYDHAVSGIVDTVSNNIYVSAVPNVAAASTSEVRFYSSDDSGATWSDETDVVDTISGQRFVDTSLGIDESSRQLYAVYNYGTSASATNVYYKSTDLPTISWSSETQITNSTGNYRGLSINSYSDELLYADFFDTAPNQLQGSNILKKPTLTETLSISDTLSLEIITSITLTETLTSSDEADTLKVITLTETLTSSDAIALTTVATTLTETLTPSDIVSISRSITLTETLTPSDTVDGASRTAGSDLDARPLAVRVFTGTSSTENTDITISPPLADESRAFAMCSFNHVLEDEHHDAFRGWEIVDESTLRIHGTSFGTNPANVNYVCNVIEFGDASTVQGSTQSFTQSASGSSTVTTDLVGQSSVDLDETMEWYQGHVHDTIETDVGAEEIDRVRLSSSTQWEWDVTTAPDTGNQDNYLGVFDWNNLDVNVQRGQTSISFNTASKTLFAGTDFTETDRSRSLLFVSFNKDDTDLNYKPNKSYIHATIDANNDLIFERKTGSSPAPQIDINWTLVELPENYANIRHGTHIQSNGVSDDTFDLDGGDAIENTGRGICYWYSLFTIWLWNR